MIDGSFGADSGSEAPHRAGSGEGSDGAVDGAEDVAFDAPEEGPANVESLGDPDVSSIGATSEDVRFDAPDEVNPWLTYSTDAAPTETTASDESREDTRPEGDHDAANTSDDVREDAAPDSGAPPERPRKDDSNVDPDDPKEGRMKAIPPLALRSAVEFHEPLNRPSTERARTADDPAEPERRADDKTLRNAGIASAGFASASVTRPARERTGSSPAPGREQGRSRERGRDLGKEL
ncbi:hypothetical protein ACFWNC_28955 [Streptomyces sp. NPDC058369]|uniref:hypothetical protein n=1 Tax=Streptomyces sp. NPDC058369 TaxID=3346462 RepID=UPI00365BF89D